MDAFRTIQKLQPCSNKDADRVLSRLRDDTGAGPGFAATLKHQRASLFAGLVVGTEAIGELTTIWTHLAGIQAWVHLTHPCFLVREALPALRQSVVPGPDQPEDDLGTILAMIQSIGQGRFTPLAILGSSAAGLYIADGNKSSVACYEHARQHRVPDAILPVVVPILPA